MTDPSYTLRITRNGTKLATEDFAAKITASQRSEVQAWLEGASSPSLYFTLPIAAREPAEPAPTPESEAPKCECNWHLGMGPNLRCPVHQGRNYVRAVPVSVPPGDPREGERIVLAWLDAMHAKYPASEYGMVAVLVRSLSRQLEEARTENEGLAAALRAQMDEEVQGE